MVIKFTHKIYPAPIGKRARLQYDTIKPGQASMGAMMLTSKILFNDHLFRIGPRDIDTPNCSCGPSRENSEHLFLECMDPWRVRLRRKPLKRPDGSEITDLQELLKEYPQPAAMYLALASQNRAYREAGADLKEDEPSSDSSPESTPLTTRVT
ncbi:hypothetical protein GJ744_002891 [Endocarpon pusillum]|uniref:Reverse transcriptase zinc-binding domain-containing protein n=1 Tax=Endocarpon pusillum TaxID=364733 RepID=A0A8H7DZP7_9EURO|nr:hypothetical protein GJ744_002891 [Endocarpon pusillum]